MTRHTVPRSLVASLARDDLHPTNGTFAIRAAREGTNGFGYRGDTLLASRARVENPCHDSRPPWHGFATGARLHPHGRNVTFRAPRDRSRSTVRCSAAPVGTPTAVPSAIPTGGSPIAPAAANARPTARPRARTTAAARRRATLRAGPTAPARS